MSTLHCTCTVANAYCESSGKFLVKFELVILLAITVIIINALVTELYVIEYRYDEENCASLKEEARNSNIFLISQKEVKRCCSNRPVEICVYLFFFK